ncbi:hypothetical protein NEUTE2DRAFT_134068 [Neurospora tetrasperma FGSC 2509]|nr:hypothetical protein NEUTE2DRAFT_134068 [Neurospora tetrasperma FGSC 2509]
MRCPAATEAACRNCSRDYPLSIPIQQHLMRSNFQVDLTINMTMDQAKVSIPVELYLGLPLTVTNRWSTDWRRVREGLRYSPGENKFTPVVPPRKQSVFVRSILRRQRPYPSRGFIFKAQGTTSSRYSYEKVLGNYTHEGIAQLSHHLTTFILRRNPRAVHPDARQSNSREPRRNGSYPSPQHLLYLYLDRPPPIPDAETPFSLNLEPKGSDIENKDKDENVYLLLKEKNFCTSFAFLMFTVMTMPPTKKRGAMWGKTRNGHLSNQ